MPASQIWRFVKITYECSLICCVKLSIRDSPKIQPIENPFSTFLWGDGFPINFPGVNDRHFIDEEWGWGNHQPGWGCSADYAHKITGAKFVISLSAQIAVSKTWMEAQLKTFLGIITARPSTDLTWRYSRSRFRTKFPARLHLLNLILDLYHLLATRL